MTKQRLAILATLILAVSGVWAWQASALGFYSANDKGDAVIAADKVVDGSAYLTANHMVVDGTVKGDLFCAGGDLTINGRVEGDVLCAGQTITVGGTVTGDIRVAGSLVLIRGKVGGNATAGGATVTVTREGAIAGDLTGGASTMILDGTVGRDMLLGAGSATLNGTIGRDVNASFSSVSVGQGAKVGGNFHYMSERETVLPQGVIAGKTEFTKQTAEDRTTATDSIAWALATALAFMLLGLVVTLIAPRLVHTAALLPSRQVALAFLVGFAGLILIPIVAGLFAITGLGLLVTGALLLAWLLMLLLSGVFVSYYVGSLVLKKRGRNALLIVLVGALLVAMVTMIPVIGMVMFIATVCTGMGMQLMHLKYQFGKKPYTIET